MLLTFSGEKQRVFFFFFIQQMFVDLLLNNRCCYITTGAINMNINMTSLSSWSLLSRKEDGHKTNSKTHKIISAHNFYKR